VILRPVTIVVLALIVANLAMMGVAIAHYPPFFDQPGALTYMLESATVLLAYAIAAVLVGRSKAADWDEILRRAILFGIFGGILEALNIAIENSIPAPIHAPAVPIGFMLVVFASWGVAGFRATRSLRSVRAGVLTAVSSAAVCILIAVFAGFLVEFFAAKPAPESIVTWGEFTRSGWTDPRAFAIANTMDSAFTHLLAAPPIALILGAVASYLAQSSSSQEIPTTSVGGSSS
jgi:hypothetical protein